MSSSCKKAHGYLWVPGLAGGTGVPAEPLYASSLGWEDAGMTPLDRGRPHALGACWILMPRLSDFRDDDCPTRQTPF